MMIDLIAEHRAEIADLCRQYGVLRLDLFGSAATGAFNEETSDLDFVATFADTDVTTRPARSARTRAMPPTVVRKRSVTL